MEKFCFILFFIALAPVFAQDSPLGPDAVDQFPEIQEYACQNEEDARKCFEQKLLLHFSREVKYPEELVASGKSSRAFVQIMINSKGEVYKVQSRSTEQAFEKEVERVFMKLPKMRPAQLRGKKVSLVFSFPVYFEWTDKQTIEANEVDQLPTFKECENKDRSTAKECLDAFLRKHIAKNFKYPVAAMRKGISGRVTLFLEFGPDGKLEVKNSISPHSLLTEEALRIVHLLPEFKAAEKNGQPTAYSYELPIAFGLLRR